MSEIKHSEIIYEEGWREAAPLAESAVPDDSAPPLDEAQPDAAAGSKIPGRALPLLTVIRLVVCLAAALVLFLLKAMDSEGYYRFMDFYREELQKPVVSQELFSAEELRGLLAPNAVTVQATPDEAARRED
ncbi:hypothetical protein [Ruminococcus sp.]|uniref:hypothetical protein n=1 Tax=Ruminococcus sp. TaxID=41978 RepID=UPI003890F9B8